MKRLLLMVAFAGALASCQRRYEGALLVKVTVAPKLVADCLRVSVFDGTNELRWTTFKRDPAQSESLVAVDHVSGFPTNVNIVASAYTGTCDDDSKLKLNSRAAPVAAVFPTTGVSTVEVALDVPNAMLDADRDGYAGGANGPDCNDADKSVFPGSVQLCSVNADTDCDGLVACADPDCASSADCANPPDRLTLLDVPLTQLRYDCLGPFTVELRNMVGPRTATIPVTVALGSSTNDVQFFESTGCNAGTAVTSTKLDFMTGSKKLWASFSTVGSTKITASAPGLTSATATIEVNPQPVSTLKLLALPTTQAAHVCSGEVTVALYDSLERPTVTPGGLSLGLQASPADTTGNFFTSNDCSGEKASVLMIPPGAGSAPLHFTGNRAGTIDITVTASATIQISGAVQITANSATKLAFLNTPISLKTTDSCSLVKLQVQSQDDYGNPAPAPADTGLVLSSSISGITFYDSGGGCTTPPITTATLTRGSMGIDFLLKATQAAANGTVTVAVTSTYASDITQSIAVSSGPATSVVLVGAAQNPIAGECSAAEIDLQLNDSSGVPSSFTKDTSFTLATTPAAAVNFYTSPGCPVNSKVGASLVVPAGVSVVRLFFSGTLAQSFSFTATTAGYAPASSTGNSVRPGAAQRMDWTPSTPVSVIAGDCTAAMKLSIFDQYNNPTSFTVDTPLTLTPALFTFDTAPGQCMGSGLKVPAGATTVSVQARGTVAGMSSVNAVAGGVAVSAVRSVTVTPAAADATKTTLATNVGSAIANDTDAISAITTVKDQFDNLISGQLVSIALSGTKNTPVNGSGSTNSSGQYTFTFTSKKAEPKTITATIGSIIKTTAVTFNAGPASMGRSLLTVVGSPSAVANGSSPVNLKFTLNDAQDNPIAGQTVVFTASGTGNSGLVASGPTGTDGAATTTIFSTVAESKMVTATSAGVSVSTGISFGAGAADQTKSTISAGPASLVADDSTTTTITVTLRDSFSNLVDPTAVTMSSTGTGNTFSGNGSTVNGVFAPTLRSKKAEMKTVTATFAGGSLSTSVNFIPGAPSNTYSNLVIAPSSQVANGTASTLTFTLKDAQQNPIPGQSVAFTSNGTSIGGLAMGTTDSSGVVTSSISSTVAQNNITVTATVAALGNYSRSATMSFTAGLATAANSTVTATPTTVVADGPSGTGTAVTVTLKDTNGNPVSGVTVTPSSSTASPGDSFSPASGVTSAGGIFTTTFKATKAETKRVIASFYSAPVVQVQSGDLTFIAGAPNSTNSTMTASPGVTANGSASSNISLTVLDANLNPVNGLAVTFSASPTTGNSGLAGGTTNALGVVTSTLSTTKAETKVVTASISGTPNFKTASTTFVAGPADTGASTISASPTSVTADGTTKITVTFTLNDAQGNPISGQPVTFTTDGSGTLSPTSGSTNALGVVTTQISSIVAKTENVTATAGSVMKSVGVTFNPGGAVAGTSSISATTPVVADGSAWSDVSVTIKDAKGNVVPGVSVTFKATGSSNTFAQATGSTNASGVYSTTLKSTKAESKTVSADVGPGPLFTLTAAPAVVFNAGTETKLVFSPAAGGSVATGGCSSTITVELDDTNNNPVTKVTYPITLALAGDPSATFYLGAGCTGGTPTGLSNSSTMSFSFKATVAQGSAALTAHNAGVTDASQNWTVTASAPTKLAWKAGSTPPGSLARFTCSNAIVVQTQNASSVATNATSAVTVNLSSDTAGAALSFFSDASCTAPISNVTVPNGASESNSFYVLATGGASTTISAVDNAAALTTVTQLITTTGASEKIVLAAPGGVDVEAGGCVTLTAQRTQSNGTTAVTKGTSTISATSGDSSVTLYASSDCATTLLGDLTITEGNSTATFYARGRSSATTTFTNVNINATETNGGLAAATALVVKSYPLVRRGTCTNTNAAFDCSTPGIPGGDPSRTFLVFQAYTAGQVNGKDAVVECYLTPAAIVHCVRGGSGGSMTIAWQTASWGRSAANGGVTVQHLQTTAGTPHNVTVNAVADLSKSFVLMSSYSSLAAPAANSDFSTARLTSTTNVEIDGSVTSTSAEVALQVVQMSGIRVDRGTNPGGAVKSVSGTFSLASPVTARLSPLFSASVGGTAAGGCNLRFRGSMVGATLTASRAAASSFCNADSVSRFAWEIIEWPLNTTVSSTNITLTNTTATDATWAPAGISSDKTILYLAGQGPGGQTSGEGDVGSDIDSEAATLVFSGATNVLLTRGKAMGTNTAIFTPFAVTFSP